MFLIFSETEGFIWSSLHGLGRIGAISSDSPFYVFLNNPLDYRRKDGRFLTSLRRVTASNPLRIHSLKIQRDIPHRGMQPQLKTPR
jgi:hypothetical protein